jgi:hypothetical protein
MFVRSPPSIEKFWHCEIFFSGVRELTNLTNLTFPLDAGNRGTYFNPMVSSFGTD